MTEGFPELVPQLKMIQESRQQIENFEKILFETSKNKESVDDSFRLMSSFPTLEEIRGT